MKREWIRPLFVVAAIYDIVLGLAFLLAYAPIMGAFGVTLPNHPAYIQYSATWVAVFGIGFLMVARHPARNRDLIVLGAIMKACYAGIVFWYTLRGQMPGMWMPMAIGDLVFLIAFVMALRVLPPPPAEA